MPYICNVKEKAIILSKVLSLSSYVKTMAIVNERVMNGSLYIGLVGCCFVNLLLEP